MSQGSLPYPAPQWDSGYHVQPSIWSKSWCYSGAHTTTPWWTHSQICICNYWWWCQGRYTGQRILGVHFLMSRYLTYTHHPTRGFSSLPVMPIMNESNSTCMSRGSMKLSWHPSLHSFSAPLEAWANPLKCSMGALLTRLPPKPNNHIPAPSYGSDAGWIFHWSDHQCHAWEDHTTTAPPDCLILLHWQSGKPESDRS